ncbi:spindle and kinetochore-associated protein 1 [Centropristis striata]|uniref:spindle and kinetochore-associated protein 1 n=1 Tax=Centropristis striata TaxID=184440 RepID=UPI0027E01281|nr:spindle and kinetochore-associated protein 1 [Centropristis striata]
MSELEDISNHIHDRISSVQLILDLSVVELPQNKIKRLGQEVVALQRLMEEFEKCVDGQKEQLKHLKEIEESFQEGLEDLQHIKNNIPAHIPRKKDQATVSQPAPLVQQVKPQNVKKSDKNQFKQIEFITVPEYDSIPQYMKGRATYHQLNFGVENINKAVAAKYKILKQPARSLSNTARKLQQRFKDQETKDTKGRFFVVEEDISEFNQMKVDKRFQGILIMLRHCQRLRELRGGGHTRYILL